MSESVSFDSKHLALASQLPIQESVRAGSQEETDSNEAQVFALLVTVAGGANAREQAAKRIVEVGFTVEERNGTSY